MELLQITKSKQRKAMLNLYFANPEKRFYLRELEKILRIPVGNVRRELLKLEKLGLFRMERKGNLTFYSLNQSHPLFSEFKSIITKTSGIPAIIKETLKEFEGIEDAFLYGSFAKGDEKADSDVDLFIIGNIDEDRLIRKLRIPEKEVQREINYSIFSRDDYEEKLKNEDSFLLSVIRGPKVFLKGSENDL